MKRPVEPTQAVIDRCIRQYKEMVQKHGLRIVPHPIKAYPLLVPADERDCREVELIRYESGRRAY